MNRLVIVVLFSILSIINGIAAHDKKVVCYYGTWAKYRPDNGKFDVEAIDPTFCTHLIYTFIGVNTDGSVLVIDTEADLPNGKDGYGRFNALKKLNPSLKTLIAMGGWNEGSSKYSQVTNNPDLRAKFVNNVVDFVLKHGFDGFDFDWEYPNQRGGDLSDKEAFVATLKALHEAFKPHGLILSCAVASAEFSASQSYLIPELVSHVDIINLMTYDLHGAWDPIVGINAPLYPRKDEIGENRNLNVDACVNYWLKSGAPPEKLVLGIPLYGRTFKLADKNNIQPGAPATGAGLAGQYSREPGMIGYNEILEISDSQWNNYWDSEGEVPYMVKDFDWIGYDNEESVYLKTQYALKQKLGGVMVWSVETDDFRGLSGKKFALLDTINNALNGNNSTTSSTSSTSSTTSTTTSTSSPDPTESTEKPTTPPNTGVCDHEGYVRDPNDCSVFYECVLEGDGYKAIRFQCGAGTYFNLETLVCDYPENVVC